MNGEKTVPVINADDSFRKVLFSMTKNLAKLHDVTKLLLLLQELIKTFCVILQ